MSKWRKRFCEIGFPSLKEQPRGGAPACFSPAWSSRLKALACELPHRRGLPLSRFSLAELRREVVGEGTVAKISGATLSRWLSRDALWPLASSKLDLPARSSLRGQGRLRAGPLPRPVAGPALGPNDYVLSADEKTSIQARLRNHRSPPPKPHRPMSVAHEYQRGGGWADLGAWDVHRAKVFGPREPKTGIAPFQRLVPEVMAQSRTAGSRRVFWIVDNGSSHGGGKADARLRSPSPTLS